MAVWIWSKDTGKRIIREPVALTYTYNNVVKTYFPDFSIDEQLVEVKSPQFFDNIGNMVCPFDPRKNNSYEAKHQCGLKHNVQFWSEKELAPILKYIIQNYGKRYLQGWIVES